MLRRFTTSSLLLVLVFTMNACTTTSGSRTPASGGDSASDSLHDRKVHEFIDRADARSAR